MFTLLHLVPALAVAQLTARLPGLLSALMVWSGQFFTATRRSTVATSDTELIWKDETAIPGGWLPGGTFITLIHLMLRLSKRVDMYLGFVRHYWPNERASGNGALALWFHVQALGRAVPECERWV
jgi:hypothetical protein